MTEGKINLLEETLEVLGERGILPSDVAWVGVDDFLGISGGSWCCTWEEFVDIAQKIDYDNGYGSNHIDMQLVVVGKSGWWLRRQEYDGAEWWVFLETPVRPDAHFTPRPEDILERY